MTNDTLLRPLAHTYSTVTAALDALALGVPIELHLPGRDILVWPDDYGPAMRLLQTHAEIPWTRVGVPDLDVQDGKVIPRHVRAVSIPVTPRGVTGRAPAQTGPLPLDRLITTLRSLGYWVRRSGRQYRCRCPYHAGRSDRSLSLGEHPDGRAWVYCFERCRPRDVLAVLGLRVADLYPYPVDLAHVHPSEEVA